MIKTLFLYILVIGGIAAFAGISGASHVTDQAIQRWEQTQ